MASADNTSAGFTKSGTVELVPGFSHNVSEEWGHGFLDVAAALMPIGQTTLATASSAVYATSQPLAVETPATGEAVARALLGRGPRRWLQSRMLPRHIPDRACNPGARRELLPAAKT